MTRVFQGITMVSWGMKMEIQGMTRVCKRITRLYNG